MSIWALLVSLKYWPTFWQRSSKERGWIAWSPCQLSSNLLLACYCLDEAAARPNPPLQTNLTQSKKALNARFQLTLHFAWQNNSKEKQQEKQNRAEQTDLRRLRNTAAFKKSASNKTNPYLAPFLHSKDFIEFVPKNSISLCRLQGLGELGYRQTNSQMY